MSIVKEKKIGLVLTGGGARAAYQVGALHAIAKITNFEKNPFSIISGYSAGALNGTWLASLNDDFALATAQMCETWSALSAENIFNVGAFSLGKIAYRWIRDRGFGGLRGKSKQITHLLDTSPLDKLIRDKIDFTALNEKVGKSHFHAVSISATDYRSGHSVAFYNGHRDIQDWNKLNRKSVRTEIKAEHVLASSAIPFFFPPVRIGDSFFGDGMVRLGTPLSAAIHLGAEKLLVIGGHGPNPTSPRPPVSDKVSLGEIMGTVLNGLFFDSLDADLERLARINRGVAAMTATERANQPDHLREVPVLTLSPQSDVQRAPSCELSRLPTTLTYLLRGIGVSENKGTDLLSYLAFEPSFLSSLVKSGYDDTMKRSQELIAFFENAGEL
jgi:NTE family protein